MMIVQLAVILLLILAAFALIAAWLTHEYREAEKRMNRRLNDRRKS